MKRLLLSATIFFCLAAQAQLAAPISFSSYNTGQVGSVNSNLTNYMSRTHIKTGDDDGSGKPGQITTFNNLPNTKGERFLFNTWVKGDSMMDGAGNKVESGAMLFNIDKMTGNLLVTQNKVDVMSVAPIGVRSFILKDGSKAYPFMHVKAIDSLRFFLNLAGNSNTKYGLYKKFKMGFKAADFFSTGIIESGQRYDEYLDQSIYYVVMPGGTSSQKIDLKAKTIKDVLGVEKEKVDQYFDQHKADDRDEKFLAGLIDYLNA